MPVRVCEDVEVLPSRVCVLNDYGERKKFHRKKIKMYTQWP